MTNFSGRIPHALATAHESLQEALGEGLRQFKANRLRYSNSREVCRCIERFVDALYEIPGGRGELQRRAALVETRCGPGSMYETARARSLESIQGQSPNSTEPPRAIDCLAKLTIDSLRGSDNVPLFLTRVTQEREGIERALKDGFLKPGFAACRAFLRWRSACRAVQKEADLLEVDGCWYLFHIHKAGDDSPSQRTKCAKAIMQPDLGVGQLEPIGAAASSMVGWVTEKAYPSDDRKPMESPVRGGGANATEPTPCEVAERLSTPSTVGEMNGGNPPPADTTVNPRLAKKAKRSTERGEGRVKLIAALTKHHKYADDGCLNLEPVGNNELARLAGVSESTASAFFNREFRGHTRYRAVCRDSAQLVVSLKTLNREYSPCHLYGGKPLGEDDCDDKG